MLFEISDLDLFSSDLYNQNIDLLHKILERKAILSDLVCKTPDKESYLSDPFRYFTDLPLKMKCNRNYFICKED